MRTSLVSLCLTFTALALVALQIDAGATVNTRESAAPAADPLDDRIPVAIIPGPQPSQDQQPPVTVSVPPPAPSAPRASVRRIAVAATVEWDDVQRQLDRCIGPVFAMLPGYGVPYVGQHNFCGGNQLSGFRVGDKVTLADAGSYSGTWTVQKVSADTVGSEFEADQVGDLVLATCLTGNRVILTALVR